MANMYSVLSIEHNAALFVTIAKGMKIKDSLI
jgi:hypothetical protein